MEFEDVSEEMAWECRRVAAAFGVGEVEKQPGHDVFYGYRHNANVSWGIHQGRWTYISVWIEGDLTDVLQNEANEWRIVGSKNNLDFLARGLYRLGFEDEFALSQLPVLSAHEKLELRLAMPREFWPQRWLDEGQTQESL